jgi:signal transduction histidine kinase/CheY-like chemotaxis protein
MPAILDRLRNELLFPVDESNLQLSADLLRTRLRLYPTMLGGQALLVVLFAWLMWNVLPHRTLMVWMLVSYALYLADMLVWLKYRDRLDTVQHCRRWHLRFSLFTAAGGLVWGSTALWLFPADAEHQALLIMVILGLAAASVTTNPSYPSSFYLYALCVVVPLILRFALGMDSAHWPMAGILSLYLAVVLKAGGELGGSFRMALKQRHENMALVEQLTEQRVLAERLRQQAETASREKSRFLATASHDLRQPLQALTLFSEALKGSASDEGTRNLAVQIESSVHALGGMFSELLDLSRLEAGMMPVNLKHFALQPLVDRLYVNFAPLAHAKGLCVEIPACDDALSLNSGLDAVVYSDPFLLERILRNLLSNAIRYTDAGKVTLRCQNSGDAMRLEVMDTGVGIRSEALPHIFDEYYQEDNPHRDRRRGLGLGLAIVRRMEKMLGYHIEVTSSLGKGSSFSFSVPHGDVEQQILTFEVTQSLHDLSGIVVALVEDDPDIRQITVELMEQWGCRVFAGELPGEVMRELDAHSMRPDLLVCDYRLPQGVSAIHALNLMREQWGDIPSMVVTGDTAPETLQEISTCGAMLLHKPITSARLRSLMHIAIYGD